MKISPKILSILAFTGLALGGFALATEPPPPAGPGQWLATGSDSCDAGETCVEWSLRQGKRDLPTGVLCCLPDKLVGSNDFNACSFDRQDDAS
ncbi:MAG: hypothetical protein AAF604_14955 [Acidobacteriota bacterium]